jgi:ATP-binding cassette subfamily B protein/subfamily B ATP-binding cassette protein MsbA
MAIILFAGANRVSSGQLSLGSLLVFLSYIKTLQQASESLWQIYGSLKPVEAGIDRVLEILDAPETVADTLHAKPLSTDIATGVRVRLEQVTFGFEPGQPVLRDVSLEVHPGEMVAFVGATGAGKSTLVSLVPRFFDPWSGCVTFNGEDLRDLRLADVRAQVAVVLQEPFLLPLSIAENIAYGRPGAARADIVAAAEAANADGFIRRLPHGYDTEIGERGATLSGGQRQRIAIARALLKDAPVLILDEPTSALDTATEAVIVDALNRLTAGRTVFVIAHRLSTVRRADRIVVLQRGEIVETGTHQQLLAARGVYYRFHAVQFDEPRRQPA